MVSVGVSALGRTDLHVVDARVKINGQHHRDVVLAQNLLPDIRQYSVSDYYTFQQDGAPAHRARDRAYAVQLLTRDCDGRHPTLFLRSSGRLITVQI